MSLTKSTNTVKDSGGNVVTVTTANDGTHNLAAIGVLGADATNFLPAGAGPASQIYTNVGGTKARVNATFTRPADTNAYTANDVVSNSTSTTTLMTFTSMARVTGGSGYIVRIRIAADQKSITPRFNLHLFNANNPTVAADNAQTKSVYADESKRIAIIPIPAMTTSADTANSTSSFASDDTIRVPFVCAADANLYGYLETLDAFTPANAGNFSVTLVAEQD